MSLSALLQQELNWLEKVIRIRSEFPEADIIEFDLEFFLNTYPHYRNSRITILDTNYHTNPPSIEIEDQSIYAGVIRKCNFEERLLLIIAISIHIEPGFINKLIEQHISAELIKKTSDFWYLTGLTSHDRNRMTPTGRFWIYLLSGINLSKRLEIINQLNNAKYHIINSGIIDIEATNQYEPIYGGNIKIAPSALNNFLKDQLLQSTEHH